MLGRASAKQALVVAILAACLACLPGCLPEANESSPRPNVILVLVDDLGWVDTGYTGSSFYETPHIDQLAATSVQFSSAYASSPVCSPTRASIMTGQHPARVRITDWIPGVDPKNRKLLGPQDRHELPLETVTLAERFKAAGYATFYAGKWHLGDEGFYPEDQGFDINRGGHHKGTPPGGYYSPYENPRLEDGPEGEYLTDRLTDETIDFIAGQGDQPFFAMLAYYTVHTPIQPSKRHVDYYTAKAQELPDLGDDSHVRERRAWVKQRQDDDAYASMVAALDENIGRLLEALDAKGLSDNTIVVFTSDNGGLSAFEGGKARSRRATSNVPLRAGKGWLYEGGIRVPLLIRAPGVNEPGARSGAPVTSADLAPTLLDLAGIEAADAGFDGTSLRPLLSAGGDLDRDAIYFHYPHYHASGSVPSAAIRAGDWKLIHFFETGSSELYRLSEDIGERNDRAAALPDKAAALEQNLLNWLESVDAPMPTPNLPPDRPNIILILADDLGYGDLGAYGQARIETPHIDRLAEQGMRFTQFYAGSTVCAPSRASLMTGLHTGHVNVRGNFELGDFTDENERGQLALSTEYQTVAELLREAGYRTALVGKWGLGGPGEGLGPLRHGFDHYFGYLDQKQAHNYYPTHLWRNDTRVPLENPFFIPHPRQAGTSTTPEDYRDYLGSDYAPDRLVDEALRFIRDNSAAPFFLLYAPNLPHAAMQIPDAYVDRYDGRWEDVPTDGGGYTPHPKARAARAGMITRLDEEVGRLRGQVEALGLAGRTLILFTSDNGPAAEGGQDLGFFEASGSLRGQKRDLYEGGIRVPLIAHWPGRVPAGTSTDHVAAQWDLLPTLAALAGQQPRVPVDGLSFADVLRGEDARHRHPYLYWEFHESKPAQAIRADRWKAIRRFDRDTGQFLPVELYDLSLDPAEARDVSADHPATVERLKTLLESARTPAALADFEFVRR